jgi:hypothetical protein
MATAIQAGMLSGARLDEKLVWVEQSIVERSLQCARVRRPSVYIDVLPTLDALLNRGARFSLLYFRPAVRWYSGVLAGVRDELNAPLEFARQAHRERIGLALIRALQREGRRAASGS